MAKKSKKIRKKHPLKPRSVVPMADQKTENPKVKKTKIRVIGIGGGGGNIVSGIASRIKKASFVVANTDRQALREARRNVIRFQFGENLTHGLGTGMNADLGETAALAEKEKIKKLFQDQDICIIVACLGGGAGSGAAPVFAKIAKSLGGLTYGIFTLPFKFEGEKKTDIARASLEKIRPRLNALSVIPNERVFQIIDKTTPLKQALSAINKNLAASLEGLIEIIYEVGLINIDFADLKTILQGKGRFAYLNTVEAPKKEGAEKEAIEKLLNSPLYPYGIRGAKGVLFNIAGEKGLTLSEVSQISKTISELANPEAKIIFGVSQSGKYKDLIKTTLLATGCQTKILSSKLSRKKHKKRKTIKTRKIRIKRRLKQRETTKRNRPAKISPSFKKNKLQKIIEKLIIKKPRKRKKIKIKIKINKESKGEQTPKPETEEIKKENNSAEVKTEEKIRKNALQIKKEAEEAEKEILEQEKIWETPAFLRRKRII